MFLKFNKNLLEKRSSEKHLVVTVFLEISILAKNLSYDFLSQNIGFSGELQKYRIKSEIA